jgi:hypothetical protein
VLVAKTRRGCSRTKHAKKHALKKQQRVTMASRSSGNTLILREGGGAGAEKESLVFHTLI